MTARHDRARRRPFGAPRAVRTMGPEEPRGAAGLGPQHRPSRFRDEIGERIEIPAAVAAIGWQDHQRRPAAVDISFDRTPSSLTISMFRLRLDIPFLLNRHCEKRSDEAIQGRRAAEVAPDRGREGFRLPSLRTVRAVFPHTACSGLVPRAGVATRPTRSVRALIEAHCVRRHVECVERRADHGEPADQHHDVDDARVADQLPGSLVKAERNDPRSYQRKGVLVDDLLPRVSKEVGSPAMIRSTFSAARWPCSSPIFSCSYVP